MATHTTGPWAAQDEAGQYLADHPWRVDNDQARATTSVPVHKDGRVIAIIVCEGWAEEELIANANLISAAPDLLEALLLHQVNGDNKYTESERRAITDAAIAKATGTA